jgi:hypothetical protein
MMIVKKRLIRKSNAPGNDLISKSKSDELIKQYDEELLDETKWKRFSMTGSGQGVQGMYGYCKKDDGIHYYYVEQHSFQTPGKQTRDTKYKNIFLDCEVDKYNNIISDIFVKPGSSEFPFIADSSLKNKYDFDSVTKVKMIDKSLENTIELSLNE